MRKNMLLCVLALAGMTAFAQKNEWQDPSINAINRAPMHTNYFAFESENAAMKGCPVASGNYMALNGTWKFNWVKDADQRPMTDFYKVDFNDKGWGTMQVPGIWEMNGYGDPVYIDVGYAWRSQFENNPPYVPIENNHVGTYRKEITIPSEWKGREIIAHFGSVTSNMYLWVNGQFVGYSEDSKLEAEFNLTKYLKPGKNLIAFQVFRWCDGTYLEDQDLIRYAGVSRDCYLYTRTINHIEDIRVTPDLDAQYKDATLQVDIQMKGKGIVDLKLLDKTGKEVATSQVKGSGKQSVTMNISNPAKWTAETPNLYKLIANLNENGKVIESIPIQVGFRKIELKNSQVWINGQPVLFKGVNRHEIDPDYGYYVSEERMIQDLIRLKELNINAVRTCHYPDNNLWYDLCDKYGFYVVAEANLESHGMGYDETTLAKNLSFAKAHLERNQRNVQRSYNHPSVIFWSLGNEAGFGPNFEACYRWIKNEDKTRPVQYEQAGTNDFTDIYCPMYSGYDRCEKYAKGDIDKPLIQCEYAHAMGNSQGGFKEYWDLIRKYPKYQGGFIWDFVDQSLRRYTKDGKEFYAYGGDFNAYDASDQNFCDNGLISPDRVFNPHADEVAYYYQNIWVNPVDLKKGIVSVYNENFFRDLGDYYAQWELQVNGEAIKSGVITDLKVAPQQSANVQLDYTLDGICACKEVLLNVYFKQKQAESFLPAGHIVAKAQLAIQDYKAPKDLMVESNCKDKCQMAYDDTASPKVKDNDTGYLIVEGEGFQIDINRKSGFISLYDVNGQSILCKGSELRPNFWRAPTDNDMGASLQVKYRVWKNPEMKLTSLEHKADGEFIVVEAQYDMPEISAKLALTYRINKYGVVEVTQQMTSGKGVEVPNMFRFGMRAELNKRLTNIQYYGRGPIENYSDRKTSTFIGRYNQTVEEQFYSYIRPQENGTKSDIRWWNQVNRAGNGVQFVADAPFSISALNYSIESLDEGLVKANGHSELVEKSEWINLCIDKVQMGLGCVTSWRTLPLDQYMLPYQDYGFKFVIKPVQHKF